MPTTERKMQRNTAFARGVKCPKCGVDELVETGGIPKGGALGGTFYAYNIRGTAQTAKVTLSDGTVRSEIQPGLHYECDKCGHEWNVV